MTLSRTALLVLGGLLLAAGGYWVGRHQSATTVLPKGGTGETSIKVTSGSLDVLLDNFDDSATPCGTKDKTVCTGKLMLANPPTSVWKIVVRGPKTAPTEVIKACQFARDDKWLLRLERSKGASGKRHEVIGHEKGTFKIDGLNGEWDPPPPHKPTDSWFLKKSNDDYALTGLEFDACKNFKLQDLPSGARICLGRAEDCPAP